MAVLKLVNPAAGFDVAHATHRAARQLTRLIDVELRDMGVTSAQLAPMLVMAQTGPVLQRDLLPQLAIGQPAMVGSLKFLEEAGFVTRHRVAGDKRAALLELTAVGRVLVESALPVLREFNDRALRGMSENQQAELLRLLGIVIRNTKSRARQTP